jgi:hypothetical protein
MYAGIALKSRIKPGGDGNFQVMTEPTVPPPPLVWVPALMKFVRHKVKLRTTS